MDDEAVTHVRQSACIIFTSIFSIAALILGVMFGLLLRTNQVQYLSSIVSRQKVKVDDDDAFWAAVDASDSSEEEEDGSGSPVRDLKLMLCVRNDLKMSKGKIAAQCGHATLQNYRIAVRQRNKYLQGWLSSGQAKVAVKLNSEDEMLDLRQKAHSSGVLASIIHDAGRTQIAAGSATVLAIGPAPADVLQGITGHLTLL